MNLECKEAFFGGAAGGGKSFSLLQGALQYAHVPKYAALILRTSTTDLRLPGGLIPKSHEWLNGKAHWNGNDSKWTFPKGGVLQFGYLQDANDKYRYRSSEFQYVAFDELTDFREEDYTFMFSRVRQTVDIGVPERVRSASNPGGVGHQWVKARFVPPDMERDLLLGQMKDVYWLPSKIEGEGPAASVPSKIRDNPAVDPEKYIRNLMHLSPVERERLMNGDWTIMPSGLIKSIWLRYFTMRDRMVDLLVSKLDSQGNIIHTQEVLHSFHEQEATRFMTIDTAGGIQDIEKQHKGKPLSYTAAGIWDHYRGGALEALLARNVWRAQGLSYTDMRDAICRVYDQWHPSSIHVENKAMGPALYDDLRRRMPIQMIGSGIIDKVVRAAPFLNMMEAGQIYLPQWENTWRHAYEGELLSWLGRKEETNDQIDVSAYAAIVCGGFLGGTINVEVDPRVTAVQLAETMGPRDGYVHRGNGMMNWS